MVRRFISLTLLCTLAACSAPPTYADVQATAQATGCWPSQYPTPPAVTLPASAVQLTPSPLPSTTPYPTCSPAPGATLVPWPTPVPNPPAYRTAEARPWQGGSDELNTLALPGTVYVLDLAVHPTENWPVVGATNRSWGSDIRAFVRAMRPGGTGWGVAQQVDIGQAANGADRNGSVAVAVTGDDTVVAVWGASDADAETRTPPMLWSSTSVDFGATWSAPIEIARQCANVQDVVADAAGNLAIIANCFERVGGSAVSQLSVIMRRAGQPWQAEERFTIGGTFAAGVIADGHIVVLTTPWQPPANNQVVILRRAIAGGNWTRQTRLLTLPDDPNLEVPSGGAAWHMRALTYPIRHANGATSTGIVFTWATYTRALLSAVISEDGGQRWGDVETIVYRSGAPDRVGALDYLAPAYDAAAQRLFVFFTCCGGAANTHQAAWRDGSGWHVLPEPVITGALDAKETVTAQAPGTSTVWLAWIERGNRVQVRAINLRTLVPADQYPTTTPVAGDA